MTLLQWAMQSGAGFAAGVGLTLAARRLRRVRFRCAWCDAVRVSAKGQACAACLDSVAREGRAAPADWPEA